jgi:hypothetical protein
MKIQFCKCGILFIAVFLFIAVNNAEAVFTSFDVESEWQSASGNTVLEDFEGYTNGEQISSLPALGVGFETLAGGGFPAIYIHGVNTTPYGTKHLGNFPNGIGGSNQWDDITLYSLSGVTLTGLGYWNGDGQNSIMIATAYDSANNILGTVGAYKGTFAGFTSDVAISRVVFNGSTGSDGWDHLDGLQTTVAPEPLSSTLFIVGGAALGYRRLRKNFNK